MNKLESMGKAAREASKFLKTATTEQKNSALYTAANFIRAQSALILRANQHDLETNPHLTPAQQDRLELNEIRLESIASGLEKVAQLPDPVGDCTKNWTVENGLKFSRIRVPIGVIGIIYESRPNVTADAGGLCLKSGNACILRSGSESFHTAIALGSALTQAISEAGLPASCIQLIPSPDRALVQDLLQLDESIDLIIPRGGESLIRRVKQDSKIPVLAHLSGNCHIYLDRDADLSMARRIILNAKMRRTGICGATETLLIHQSCLTTHAEPILSDLQAAGCEIRADAALIQAFPNLNLTPACEQDWATEYLDAILAVKLVENTNEALSHIQIYSSGHTDGIITTNQKEANLFLHTVDSAIVLHNASTQFADGGEFGMGAEIGIATGRLHARGPVGLEELTTYKTIIHGNGQIRPA